VVAELQGKLEASHSGVPAGVARLARTRLRQAAAAQGITVEGDEQNREHGEVLDNTVIGQVQKADVAPISGRRRDQPTVSDTRGSTGPSIPSAATDSLAHDGADPVIRRGDWSRAEATSLMQGILDLSGGVDFALLSRYLGGTRTGTQVRCKVVNLIKKHGDLPGAMRAHGLKPPTEEG